MPNIYKGYCYPTLTDVGNAVVSDEAVSGSAGVAAPNTFATTAIPNQLSITYAYKPYTVEAQVSHVLVRTFPTCTDIGYQNNQTGIDLVDATATSWAVVAVLVAAWAFRTLRTTL